MSERLWLVTVEAGESYWFADFAVTDATSEHEAIATAQQTCDSLKVIYPHAELTARNAREVRVASPNMPGAS